MWDKIAAALAADTALIVTTAGFVLMFVGVAWVYAA